MRPSIAVAIALLLTVSAMGQTNNDSAMTELAKNAFAVSTQKPDSGMAQSAVALKYYQRTGNKLVGGFAYKARGWSYLHQGNYDSAYASLKQSAALFLSARDTAELMFVYLNLARAYSNNSEYGKSAAALLQADTLADRSTNLKAKAIVQNQMGILLRMQQQYTKAIPYFKEAIAGYLRIEDTTDYLSAVGSLSILYTTISMPDSSLAWLDKTIPIIRELKGLEYEKAMVYEKYGDTWSAKHQYGKSFDSYKQAYDIFQHTHAVADQAFEGMNIGAVLTSLKRSKEAEAYLLQSYKLNDSLHLVSYTKDAALALSDLYDSTKDYAKAYQWLVTTRRLQDSLTTIQEDSKTIELQTKYEAEKKDKEIALLKKDQEVRAADLQKERAIRISATILTGLIILIGFLVINRYRLIQKTRRLVEIEKLRNTIARDLHDDLGSVLSSIHINSNMALSHPEQQQMVQGQLEKIQKHSGRMMESMGDIVWAINPVNDSMENLQAKMKEFLAEILEPLNITYHITGMEHLKKVRFDIGRRKEIYLIFKEAVNNAAKYSGATRVLVSVRDNGRETLLQVEDNGKGFDTHNIRPGNGLRNMQHRAQLIGGTLDISATPGKGATVVLHIPVT